jgi:hypothetical protein
MMYNEPGMYQYIVKKCRNSLNTVDINMLNYLISTYILLQVVIFLGAADHIRPDV